MYTLEHECMGSPVHQDRNRSQPVPCVSTKRLCITNKKDTMPAHTYWHIHIHAYTLTNTLMHTHSDKQTKTHTQIHTAAHD